MQKKRLNIVITGGNSGIGYETMKDLYLRGYNIVFGSRNQARNEEALNNILNAQKQGLEKNQHFIKAFSLDLSKKNSIEKFVSQVKSVYKHIDILINNAGLIINELDRNQNGIQMTLAINHFGPFYLTYLLFDLIKNVPEGRIINVSSMVHYNAPNRILTDIECKQKSFRSMEQYQISKFMNVLFTQQLFRKISKYPNLKAVSLHPGIVDSNFGSDVCLIRVFNTMCCCIYVTNVEGARTSIYLSTEEFSRLRNGEYYHSNTELKEMDERARDPRMAEELWKMSEKVYGISFQP